MFQEALAFLTLGLVRPWGEVWPRWVPHLRGRHIPVRAVVVPAAAGALACTVHGVLIVWTTLHSEMAITPWGPLPAIVTTHYYRRRTRR